MNPCPICGAPTPTHSMCAGTTECKVRRLENDIERLKRVTQTLQAQVEYLQFAGARTK